MVQMFVNKVAVDPQGRALVFLTDEANRRLLPIWIGIFEAQAIAAQMREDKFPRPMTHDLLKTIIESTGHRLSRIRVTQLENKTFYAVLDLEAESGPVEVDARPSDAIALALRAGAPIYVAEEVLAEAEIPTEKAEEEEMATFKRLMSTLPEGMEIIGSDSGSGPGISPEDQAPEAEED